MLDTVAPLIGIRAIDESSRILGRRAALVKGNGPLRLRAFNRAERSLARLILPAKISAAAISARDKSFIARERARARLVKNGIGFIAKRVVGFPAGAPRAGFSPLCINVYTFAGSSRIARGRGRGGTTNERGAGRGAAREKRFNIFRAGVGDSISAAARRFIKRGDVAGTN